MLSARMVRKSHTYYRLIKGPLGATYSVRQDLLNIRNFPDRLFGRCCASLTFLSLLLVNRAYLGAMRILALTRSNHINVYPRKLSSKCALFSSVVVLCQHQLSCFSFVRRRLQLIFSLEPVQ
ncbi:hypothetical protein BDN70DRAFT_180044 [Pholiota conissans]|uniref:Uncharacterized protein n=1 Tax=Pholiota conissans TaxID=109636 RepID=A0A9P5ZDW5_9AGAR|nr:hypothetical protein BDN70DRAFT_180044 [Pholiota conissans]